MKILFLDVDGVLNSRDTIRKSTTNGVAMIDPYMVLLVNRIIEATGAKVVLSSSWRHAKGGDLIKIAGVEFIDITPTCCTGIRGAEIYHWITRNIPYEDRDTFRYAILDDEGDMLLWQKDSFFQTSFETGITEEIANAVIKHLNS